jgi:hypothetical protein
MATKRLLIDLTSQLAKGAQLLSERVGPLPNVLQIALRVKDTRDTRFITMG